MLNQISGGFRGGLVLKLWICSVLRRKSGKMIWSCSDLFVWNVKNGEADEVFCDDRYGANVGGLRTRDAQ